MEALNQRRHSLNPAPHAKLKVHEPAASLPLMGTQLGELLEWSTRQILITKIYSRRLWQLAFVSRPIPGCWWWGVGRTDSRLHALPGKCRSAEPNQPPGQLGIILIIYLFESCGVGRLRAVSLIFSERTTINRFCGATYCWLPVSTFDRLHLLVSLLTSTLEWRGVRYELSLPKKCVWFGWMGPRFQGYPEENESATIGFGS